MPVELGGAHCGLAVEIQEQEPHEMAGFDPHRRMLLAGREREIEKDRSETAARNAGNHHEVSRQPRCRIGPPESIYRHDLT